jgi:type I restriction enzyme S subunit
VSPRPLADFLACSPRNGFSPNETEDWTGVLALGLGCLTVNGFAPRQLKNVPARDVRYAGAWLSDGDLLMSRSNTLDMVGLVGRYRDVGTPCVYPDLMMRLTPNSLVLPRFLEITLQSSVVRAQIKSHAQGTSASMAKISAATIQRLQVRIPALAGQQRIVEIFDAADATIDATRKVAEKLETTASALTTAQLATLARNAPATVPLSDVADVLSGVTLGSEPGGAGSVELPYLRVANVQDGRIDTGEMKSIRILRAELPKYLLRTGDVLLTEGGDLDKLGRGAMWDGRIPQCITQNHVFRVRCNESRVLPGYLSAYIGSPMGKAYFLKIAKQTTNLASINSTQLKALPLPVPDLPDQSALIDLMTAGSSQVTVERRRLAKLQTLRHGLMDDLLTGRVRVPAR